MQSRVPDASLKRADLSAEEYSASRRILPQDMPPSPPDSQKSTTSPWTETEAPVQSPSWSQTVATTQMKPAMGERKNCVGQIHVSLPEGIVTEVVVCSEEDRHLANLVNGSSFLKQLHGISVQTFLMHAFCGDPTRQMFARLNCGGTVRAYEFLCRFVKRERWSSIGAAIIDVLPVRSSFGPCGITPTSIEFTTRHNSSGGIVYVDAKITSILGRFPSELTGKSLFSIIHNDDVDKIRSCHHSLLQIRGKVVLTECLRLIAHNGSVVCVRSQWVAFMNPWNRQLEMIVGQHLLLSQTPIGDADVLAEPYHGRPLAVPTEQIAEHDRYLRNLLRQPVPRKDRSNAKRQYPFPMFSNFSSPVPDPSNFGTGMEKLVGPLVVHANPSNTSVNALPNLNDSGTDEAVQDTASGAPLPLTYNQINCLENVHRLLKSQSAASTEETPNAVDSPASPGASADSQELGDPEPAVSTVPLTRDVLQRHTQKWEQEYKNVWKNRLNLKRLYPYSVDENPGSSPECSAKRRERSQFQVDHSLDYLKNYQAQYMSSVSFSARPHPAHAPAAFQVNMQSAFNPANVLLHSLNFSSAAAQPFYSVIQNGSFHSQHSQLVNSLPVATLQSSSTAVVQNGVLHQQLSPGPGESQFQEAAAAANESSNVVLVHEVA
ncbi:hypothetical protein L596_002858 [Steinernema carpocapsae]|uniref:PAS domain-containing protein n=1 Tax=Steinernema carpocapsae TaxID=34508 RepID=A0A4U8USC2_STECR|nr:hypothetical protein L596_002858 [Steinernema carpocapsae]